MTWTKIDDQLHSHPKVQQAWHQEPAALGLHLLALSHSSAYLTNGHVSAEFVKTQLPAQAKRRRAVAALLDSGLWELNGQGWVIHDYLEFNESREHVLERREERAQQSAGAGRRGAAKRWKTSCSPIGELIAPGRNGKPIAPSPSPFPNTALS